MLAWLSGRCHGVVPPLRPPGVKFCSLALSWGSRIHMFLLGKEETKRKAQQTGVHTLVAACLSVKARSKAGPCLE